MEKATEGEQFKMQLLTGKLGMDQATDMLLDMRSSHGNEALLGVILPMAQLRAEQIEERTLSDDRDTRVAARNMQQRYEKRVSTKVANAVSTAATEQLGEACSPFAAVVAGDWMNKIITNSCIGDLEAELQQAVDIQRSQHQAIEPRHSLDLAR